MKNLKKKGFTIVELVIVIAVIAILSAVLIPTFSNLVKKANLSADQQAVRQMNAALMVENNPDNIDDAINALAVQGYNSKKTLVPVSSGYAFYWYQNAKKVVLVKDNVVVFPEGVEYEENGISLESSMKLIDISTDDKNTLFDAFQNSNQNITLEGNVKVSGSELLVVQAGAEIEFNLNNKTLEADLQSGHNNKHYNAVTVSGKLTIKDGTINTRNIYVNPGAELILENVNVNALDTDGGACVYIESGAKVTIKNGNFTSASFTYAIKNNGGDLIIENANVTSTRGAIACESGSITINGGTYTVTGEHSQAAHTVYANNGNIEINGGTFENLGNNDNVYCVESTGIGSIKLENGEIIKNE